MDNELYDVKNKPTKPKFIMGRCIVNKFISLTYGNNDKVYVKATEIIQLSKTSRGTCLYLHGSDTPLFVKESVNEIFTKIDKIY